MALNSTYTQAEVETEVCNALNAGSSTSHDWETVSDAVDVHLGRIEREQSQQIDRATIPRDIVLAVLETIVQTTQAPHP